MSTIYFSALNSDEKIIEESPFHPAESHACPLIGKPVEIGCFSVDSNSVFYPDNRLMRNLVLPDKNTNLCINLDENFDVDAHRDYITLEKMHNTLKWLLSNSNSQSLKDHRAKCSDFVTVRGTLKLIACTPYLKGFYRQEWEVCASKFKGTIYLAAIDTDTDIEDNKNLTKRQAKLQAWGYKFEQLMTADAVDRKCSRTFQMEEYCIVLKNILGGYNLLYSAEIDAAIPHRYPGPGSGNTACYTELKTSKEIENEGGRYYFLRYKLVTWWAQSFLCGIPEIICGLRNDEGIVKKLEVFNVSTLPEKAMGLWSSDSCLSFCVKFLDFLKRTVTEDNANIVYKFHYKGGDTIHCTKITSPSSRYRVIPDWFVEGLEKHKSV